MTMFNLTFTTIEEAKKLNNLTEAQIVSHLKRYFDNQNYRTSYNQRKTQLGQLLKNDPVVQQRMKELSKKAK
jgi:hypothetical protein